MGPLRVAIHDAVKAGGWPELLRNDTIELLDVNEVEVYGRVVDGVMRQDGPEPPDEWPGCASFGV